MGKRELTLRELNNQMVAGHVPEVAEHLDKAGSTVYSEFSPHPTDDNRHHKLGLLDWIKTMVLLKDFRPLRKVAQMCDHIAVPIPHEHPTDKSLLLKLAAAEREHGEAAAALLEKLGCEKTGREHREALRKAVKEQYESMEAAAALYVDLAEMLDKLED